MLKLIFHWGGVIVGSPHHRERTSPARENVEEAHHRSKIEVTEDP